ncbi:hypothetical protein [Propionivibrio sp.]|uniref:hypothetical protein n=1 Tax=Propionivibrio sp. TaxID=2212460 RepID=UPI0039E6859E
MDTENLSEKTLKAYGQSLANAADSSQWQQLWRRTRAEGCFQQESVQRRFTLPMQEIPKLVATTLRDAHDVQSNRRTQAIYRHDFAPRVVGAEGTQNLTAVCLTVNWRSLPEHTATDDMAQMVNISLLLVQPCQ